MFDQYDILSIRLIGTDAESHSCKYSQYIFICFLFCYTGINSQLRYSLAGGDKKNQFDIGPLNGTIYTIGFLNREAIPTYHLIVIATDQAEPPSDRLSTSATVIIPLVFRPCL